MRLALDEGDDSQTACAETVVSNLTMHKQEQRQLLAQSELQTLSALHCFALLNADGHKGRSAHLLAMKSVGIGLLLHGNLVRPYSAYNSAGALQQGKRSETSLQLYQYKNTCGKRYHNAKSGLIERYKCHQVAVSIPVGICAFRNCLAVFISALQCVLVRHL